MMSKFLYQYFFFFLCEVGLAHARTKTFFEICWKSFINDVTHVLKFFVSPLFLSLTYAMVLRLLFTECDVIYGWPFAIYRSFGTLTSFFCWLMFSFCRKIVFFSFSSHFATLIVIWRYTMTQHKNLVWMIWCKRFWHLKILYQSIGNWWMISCDRRFVITLTVC